MGSPCTTSGGQLNISELKKKANNSIKLFGKLGDYSVGWGKGVVTEAFYVAMARSCSKLGIT